MPEFFPTDKNNLLICVTGASARKNFSVLIVDKISCLDMVEKAQCFPLNYYVSSERRDGVSDWILTRAKNLYGWRVDKEDIFYYVYGFLLKTLDIVENLPAVEFEA